MLASPPIDCGPYHQYTYYYIIRPRGHTRRSPYIVRIVRISGWLWRGDKNAEEIIFERYRKSDFNFENIFDEFGSLFSGFLSKRIFDLPCIVQLLLYSKVPNDINLYCTCVADKIKSSSPFPHKTRKKQANEFECFSKSISDSQKIVFFFFFTSAFRILNVRKNGPFPIPSEICL